MATSNSRLPTIEVQMKSPIGCRNTVSLCCGTSKPTLTRDAGTWDESKGDKMRIGLLVITFLVACPGRTIALDLYVSPTGDDEGSGSLEIPFASLHRARDEIRTLKGKGAIDGPVRVIVADGNYDLSTPFELLPQDSGTRDAPVIYQAADGARPVFSGGRQIRNWTLGPDGVWTTRIPEVAHGGWYFEQLFVNGRRAVRAREAE